MKTDADVYEPLPVATLTSNGRAFRATGSQAAPLVPAQSRLVVLFTSATLDRFEPNRLIVDLASGKTLNVNVRPFIYLFKCAAATTRRLPCFVGGLPVSANVTPVPRLISQGGAVALTTSAPRRLPKGCAGRKLQLNRRADQQCLRAGTGMAQFYPVGLDRRETWHAKLPLPPEP